MLVFTIPEESNVPLLPAQVPVYLDELRSEIGFKKAKIKPIAQRNINPLPNQLDITEGILAFSRKTFTVEILLKEKAHLANILGILSEQIEEIDSRKQDSRFRLLHRYALCQSRYDIFEQSVESLQKELDALQIKVEFYKIHFPHEDLSSVVSNISRVRVAIEWRKLQEM